MLATFRPGAAGITGSVNVCRDRDFSCGHGSRWDIWGILDMEAVRTADHFEGLTCALCKNVARR
jgi:hypothetical protein